MAVDLRSAGGVAVRPARIMVTERHTMAATISASYNAGVLVAITDAARQHLQHELGSPEALVNWLIELVRDGDKPICLHVEAAGKSRTYVAAPENWSGERLKAYVTTMAPQLAAEFGSFTL